MFSLNRSRQQWRAGAIAVLTALALATGAHARVWNVNDIASFDHAMGRLGSGDEVVLAAGTYDLTQRHGYYVTTPNITIRGATGDRDDVTLWGGGINNTSGIREAIQLVAAGQTVRDLTIEGFYHHAIHFQSAADNAHVYNVKTLNIGEQHMKGVGHNTGVVEYCEMAQTETRLNGLPDRPDEYVGGIDLINGANGWAIRDNYIHDIHGALGDGDAGIFLWQSIADCVIERNVIVNVNKGIALGNPSSTNGAEGCIVRNNFVVQFPPNDLGIEVCYTTDCAVYNNTIYHTTPYGSNWHRTLQVYGTESGLAVINNIIRGNVKDSVAGDWSNAAVRAMGNIVDNTGAVVTAAWFEDYAAGDLHLTAAATAAFDVGTALADVLEDIDTGFRSLTPDLGADEYLSPYPGDANRDGNVDVFDLAALANSYGQNGPKAWVQGDFTLDYTVDVYDLAVLGSNYGWVSGTGGGSAGPTTGGVAVPEPAALSVLLLAAVRLGRRRRR